MKASPLNLWEAGATDDCASQVDMRFFSQIWDQKRGQFPQLSRPRRAGRPPSARGRKPGETGDGDEGFSG